jgi:hypothetical protein
MWAREGKANLAARAAAIADCGFRIAGWEGQTGALRQTKPIFGVLGPETAVGRKNKANWGGHGL